MLLYDMTNLESFEHISDWLQEARKQIEPNNVIFMLIGTKKDKENLREVSKEQAQQFADYHNLLFLETSSKTGYNVENAFKLLATCIYEQFEDGKFKIIEGWEGIKGGYINSHYNQEKENVQLNLIKTFDDNIETNEKIIRNKCC
jgi:GTPase SAR1 family protein